MLSLWQYTGMYVSNTKQLKTFIFPLRVNFKFFPQINIPQSNNLPRKKNHLSSLVSKFWTNYVLQHSHISLCCSGPMTTMKPHIFYNCTKLTDKSNLRAVGYLMKHWPNYGTGPEEKQASTPWLCPPSQGTVLDWHCYYTIPQISHNKGEMDKQKGLPEGAHRRNWWRAQQMLCGLCQAQ